ncbi:hypothetical protein [Kutzneria sp. NPDC051319]|uniref:hypothetical protein n=1 Tax=Kutzneria sp. NPDC051319 TaxID=3155047 RepID=UPI00342898F6
MDRCHHPMGGRIPINTALFERFVALRHRYTGEPEALLRPALAAGLHSLTRGDIEHLAAAMDDGASLPQRLRAAVLPDTVLPRQQELESAIFETLCQATHLDGPENALHRHFRMVRPHGDYLVVHLSPESVEALVGKLLPSEGDDGYSGYPGLRVRAFRRHAELYFADGAPGVAVHLAQVHWGLWREVSEGRRWLGNDTEPLTPDELRAMEIRRSSAETARLGSALLRRLGMFSGLPLAIMGADLCYVDWRNRPSRGELAELLTHPVAGIGATGYRRVAGHLVVDAAPGRVVLHGPTRHTWRSADPCRRVSATCGSDQPKRPEM